MNTPDQQRHILEMCAKACGYEFRWQDLRTSRKGKFGDLEYSGRVACIVGAKEFNPLADTEAGRSQCAVMCAELDIDVIWEPVTQHVQCFKGQTLSAVEYYADHLNKRVAWQAAACAVACAIGENMK